MNIKFTLATFFFLALASNNVNAAQSNSTNLNVELLSAVISKDYILVQTNPRPNISGLSCTSDYWVALQTVLPNTDEIYTMLVTAQTLEKKINITIDDDFDPDPKFCRITRVTLGAN